MRRIAALTVVLAGLLRVTPPTLAADYQLDVRPVAPGTYAVIGATEDFDTANGGNVVNCAFVVTTAGVIVVDTGPTARYGEALRRAIRAITPLPVVRVLNTHHHPDHILGNQAFADVGIEAAEASIAAQAREGPAFLDNMYRLVLQWAAGTALHPATRAAVAGPFELGDHRFELHLLGGHTVADLALLDVTTGVLFAGDLVFHGRAPTVPHADADTWLASLDRLGRLPATILVPGHGDVTRPSSAIAETAEYVRWLRDHLEAAAAAGLDVTDVLALTPPDRFRSLAVIDAEYRRAVLQWYPAIERRHLHRSGP